MTHFLPIMIGDTPSRQCYAQATPALLNKVAAKTGFLNPVFNKPVFNKSFATKSVFNKPISSTAICHKRVKRALSCSIMSVAVLQMAQAADHVTDMPAITGADLLVATKPLSTKPLSTKPLATSVAASNVIDNNVTDSSAANRNVVDNQDIDPYPSDPNNASNIVATAPLPLVAIDEVSATLFLQCAGLQTDAARLACYDKVAIGQPYTAGQEKKPLDLVESFKASIHKGRPAIVLVDKTTTDPRYPHDPYESNNESNAPHQSQPDTLTASHERSTALTESTILAKVGVTPGEIHQYTPLSLAYDLDKNSERGILRGRPYKPMYLLPVFATFERNRHPHSPTLDTYNYSLSAYNPVELKAQVSIKTKIMEDVFDTNADVWFGYTQQMHWQVYNQQNSRPFRGTDYMPELFITQPVAADLPYDGQLRMLGAGVIHHSNGQAEPLSRSWNRLYLMGGAEWGNLSILPKAWIHVKNETPEQPSDNPDITDYYGHGEIQALYDFGKGETLGATGRYNFSEANGAIELNYIYPFTRDVRGFLQIFHGYGESIIDYNHKSTSVGLGVTLNDWKGL